MDQRITEIRQMSMDKGVTIAVWVLSANAVSTSAYKKSEMSSCAWALSGTTAFYPIK